MVREKTSIIWNVSKDEFEKLIKESRTYKEVLSKLGIQNSSGGNYKTLKQRIKLCDISTKHIEDDKKRFRGGQKQPLSKYLVKGSSLRTSSFRKRLISEGFLQNKCSECGQLPLWNNKPLVLQLDHINGDNNDNRLDNLRILCPHCHTQTETYGGRNCKKLLESDFCNCGAKKMRKSNKCRDCREYDTKIIWPEPEVLQKMLLEKPTTQIAKEIGVSDSMVGYHAKKIGLEKPTRGYWSKRRDLNPQ